MKTSEDKQKAVVTCPYCGWATSTTHKDLAVAKAIVKRLFHDHWYEHHRDKIN